jgi:hypothetical protein
MNILLRWSNRLLALSVVGVVMSGTYGCGKQEREAAPNETTAAPARLPGEDPHSPTATATPKTRK